MIFCILIIFIAYILSFSLVGLWTVQFLVLVQSIGYNLRSRAKDMMITIVIINPRSEIGLEYKWRHARKRWSGEFEDFEKKVSRELTLGHVNRQLGCVMNDPLRPLFPLKKRGSPITGDIFNMFKQWKYLLVAWNLSAIIYIYIYIYKHIFWHYICSHSYTHTYIYL